MPITPEQVKMLLHYILHPIVNDLKAFRENLQCLVDEIITLGQVPTDIIDENNEMYYLFIKNMGASSHSYILKWVENSYPLPKEIDLCAKKKSWKGAQRLNKLKKKIHKMQITLFLWIG